MSTAPHQQDNRFVAYEYSTLQVKPDQESLIKDAYASLGWACESVDRPSFPGGPLTLRLKRDRAIPERQLLGKLQRQLEATLERIDNLHRSKTLRASVVALSVGVLGSAALAGSVFCFMASLWVPFVLLGIVGLIGWVVPYFAFTQVKAVRSAAANQEIDQQYDQLYAICERAAGIVRA